MIIFAILITIAILMLVIIFITRPLSVDENGSVDESESKKANLMGEYQVTLNRIRELEQELIESKLSEEDYQFRRQLLNREAAGFLNQYSIDPSDEAKTSKK